MNSRFNWDLVPSFLAVLQHGSLLGAAKALQASQPTLGRHIAELESQLGQVLFERTGRGLVPTVAALRVADAARSMEAGALLLARNATATQKDAGGTVRISASTPVATYLLPQVLAKMRRLLPHIHVELVATNEVSNLLRREADIAVRMVRPQQTSLVARKIAMVGLGAYAHRNYLVRRGTPKVPEEFAMHELIGDDKINQIQRGFRHFGIELPDEAFVLRTDDLVVQCQAVFAGIGIGFLADYVAAGNADVNRVVPSLPIPPLPMWLVVHREIRSNPRIRSVFDLLAAELPGMV